jgi:hypothetical protein
MTLHHSLLVFVLTGLALFFLTSANEGYPPALPLVNAALDADGDNASDAEEAYTGTDPYRFDTDLDGISDGDELQLTGTNPLVADSDGDGMSDGLQWWSSHMPPTLAATGPLVAAPTPSKPDTDGDQIPDNVEVFYGLNPYLADDAQGDLDGNGQTNVDQFLAGIPLTHGLSSFDRDGDGMTDVFEVVHGFNPNDAADAVLDADNDGVLNVEEAWLNLSPANSDTLNAGGHGDWGHLIAAYSSSAFDVTALSASWPYFHRLAPGDWDNDGLPDAWEHSYGAWRFLGGQNLRQPDTHLDSDGDGLSSIWEFKLSLNPLIADSDGDGILDGDEDADGDGLSNKLEIAIGSSPLEMDTDQDGYHDGLEHAHGANPVDASSTPEGVEGVSLIIYTPLENGPGTADAEPAPSI